MISSQDPFRQQVGPQIEDARRRSQVGDLWRASNEPGPFPDDILSDPGSSGAGQFKFNITEIDSIITKLHGIIDDAQQQFGFLSETLLFLQAPASDDPSRSQTKASKQSISKAREHLQAVVNYGRGYIEKLQKAKEQYQGVDADNTDTLTRQGM